MGCLSRPGLHLVQVDLVVGIYLTTDLPIIENHLRRGFGITFGLHIKFQNASSGIHHPVLRHCEILNMCLRTSK